MSRPPYAPRGLLGVLTPQANTTVEPEFGLLLPPGMAMLNARMTSGKPTIIARLLDYLAALESHAGQFANAPVEAIAFACTGASYFAMPEAEDAAVARIEAATGLPFITTARAVRDALDLLGAKRIGLVSPYPDDLTRAGIAYWQARGYAVAAVSGSVLREGAFHPIYAMDHDGATEALMALNPEGLDAIVMLGTGMPTLAAIRATPFHGGVPVLSCMLALGWASASALGGPQPVLPWIEGRGWGGRLDSVFAGGQTGAA